MLKHRSRRPDHKSLRFESLEIRDLLAQLNFGIPFSLGLDVNTAEVEQAPSTTADELSLFFWRTAGANVPTEILEATRTSTDAPFGNAVSAGAAVNAVGFSAHPYVSPDGLSLLFSTEDDGGLYQATRDSRSEPFGSVTSLGDLLPGQPAHQPSLSADGLTLFFTAWDTAGVQNDIYQATYVSLTSSWGNVVKLGDEINIPGYKDAMPSISSDGLRLFFNSNRPGGFGRFDLYVATRASVEAPWQQAVNLGAQVNTAYDDKGPSISFDGSLVYFHSDRPGGAGAEDLYAVTVDYNDTKFYVVDDATRNRTYEYGTAGESGESYNLNSGNLAPRGAASTTAGDTVWVVDANKNVYVYGPGGNLLGSWAAGGFNNSAQFEGIAVAGNDVWIVDNKSDRFYRFAGAASRLTSSQNAMNNFPLNSGNKDASDLVTDGTNIWVLNNTSGTDKVFKYRASDGALLGSWTITGGGGNPTGITLDPSNATQDLWIVDSNSDKVYRLPSGRTTPGISVVATELFALSPGNTNPQGIADPPLVTGSGVAAPVSTDLAVQATSVRNAARALQSPNNFTPTKQIPTSAARSGRNRPVFLARQAALAGRSDRSIVVESRVVIDAAFAALGDDEWHFTKVESRAN